MNKNGFAVTGILYTLLLIAIVSLNLLLYNLLNRKTMLDQIKADTVNAIEKDSDFDYLLEQINEIKSNIITIDKVYPIGSIYITRDNTNPNTLFEGTTWERYGVGRTLLSTDGTSDITGGNNSITLKTSNLPLHSHSIPVLKGKTDTVGHHSHLTIGYAVNEKRTGTLPAGILGINDSVIQYSTVDYKGADTGRMGSTNDTGNHTHTVATNASVTGDIGDNEPIDIMNPYITVYMWKRIS